jgi:hypothetical protein
MATRYQSYPRPCPPTNVLCGGFHNVPSYIVLDHGVELVTKIERAGLMFRVKPVVKKLVKATGAENYNILQNNGRIAHQEVDHVCVPLAPRIPHIP